LASGLGPALGNHLWQSTVFVAVAGLATLLLRKNQASARYGLWLAASVKFLIPFSLLVGLGGLLPRPRPAVIQPQMTVYSAIDVASQPFRATMSIPSSTHDASWMDRVVALVPAVLAAVWLCGVGMVLLMWFVRWRRVSATLRESAHAMKGRELEILRRLECNAKANGRIALMHSQEMMEPGIFGIVRPVLLWPVRLTERLEDGHIEAILAHELLHVRRHDNLAAATHMVVEALFWFHPMVWWMESRMVEERERACDEAVIEQGARPNVYAESLLMACRFCLESPLVCVSGIAGANLRRRIIRIMGEGVTQKLDFTRKLILVLAGLAAVAVPVAFGLIHASQVQAQSPASDWQTAAGGKMEFESASIRPGTPGSFTPPNFALDAGDTFGSSADPNGRFSADFTLPDYIMFAYKLWLTQDQIQSMIAQLPAWVARDSFVIEARAPGNPTKDQMRLMMQSLLADRFKLAVHFESRQVPVFALVPEEPGKTGPKLRPHADGPPCAVPNASSDPPSSSNATDVYPPFCDGYWVNPEPGHKILAGSRDTTMKLIAAFLPSVGHLGRPVVDQTGMTGRFDFSFELTENPGNPPPSGDGFQPDVPIPALLQALKDQLGLKLKPIITPLDVLMIDHIERPTDN
jgi:uncharacterized protein (TIGR03435 family)